MTTIISENLHKRKVDSVTPDDYAETSNEKLKKSRLTQESGIAIETTFASPFSKSSITAKGPTFNLSAFNTSAITPPVSCSFPPVSAVTKTVKPASAIHQSVVFPKATIDANNATVLPTPSKSMTSLPETNPFFPKPTKPKTVSPTSDFQQPNLDLKKYIRKMHPTFTSFNFVGQALKEVVDDKFQTVFDACMVHTYVRTVELDIASAKLDINLFWPKYIFDCISKDQESKPSLCAWIMEKLDPSFSWKRAKSILLSGLGVYSRNATYATKSQVHCRQSNNESFADYESRYTYIAEAALLLIKRNLAHQSFSTESKLIDRFIQGARYLGFYLTELCDDSGASDSWKDFEIVMCRNRDEMQFLDLKARCEQGFANEEQMAEYREIVKRRVKSAKMKAKRQAKKTQKLQTNSTALMNERKEKGLCSFCGVVKHSFKHNRACDAKKKYYENGKILPK